MIEFKYYRDIPKYFTGVCKTIEDNIIRHYKNGLFHREDGPAKIFEDSSVSWWFENNYYGRNSDFTNETWIEFVENLKRAQELKIFI